MEDQIIIGGPLNAAEGAADSVWDGGGSGGSSGSSGNSSAGNPVPVEIRPDDDETVPPPQETTVPATEETRDEEVVVISILEEETTEATETVAVEAPVAADLTGGEGSGSWLFIAAGLAAVLILGLVIGKAKKKK